MTPAELADLAESLVPVAARLVGAVHDDGVAEVGRVLSAVNAADLPALAVVLAAMVDPDMTPGEMLAWVTWDEDAPRLADPTLFGPLYAVRTAPPDDPRDWPDERCRRLHDAWRRRQNGHGDPRADPELEQAGYREWQRRRKRSERARRRAKSTQVSC